MLKLVLQGYLRAYNGECDLEMIINIDNYIPKIIIPIRTSFISIVIVPFLHFFSFLFPFFKFFQSERVTLYYMTSMVPIMFIFMLRLLITPIKIQYIKPYLYMHGTIHDPLNPQHTTIGKHVRTFI